jgi:hypothetical protein
VFRRPTRCSSKQYLFYCQVTLHVSGVFRTHHQEYTNCSYNHWYKSWIWWYNGKIRLKRVHGRAGTSLWTWPKYNWSSLAMSKNEVAARSWTLLNGFYHYISKFVTCTSGCNYSLCTPDDGCVRHPKHVEWLGSIINRDCLELHLVGLLNTRLQCMEIWTKNSW